MDKLTKLKIRKAISDELMKNYFQDSASSVGGALMIGVTSLLKKIKTNLGKAEKIEKEAIKKGVKPKPKTKSFLKKNHRIVFNVEKELKNIAKGGAVVGTGAAGISAVNNENENKETMKQMQRTINILKKQNKEVQQHLNKSNERMYKLSQQKKVSDSAFSSIISKLKKDVKKGDKIQKQAKKEKRNDEKTKKHYSILQKIKLFLKGMISGGSLSVYGFYEKDQRELEQARKAQKKMQMANNKFQGENYDY